MVTIKQLKNLANTVVIAKYHRAYDVYVEALFDADQIVSRPGVVYDEADMLIVKGPASLIHKVKSITGVLPESIEIVQQ